MSDNGKAYALHKKIQEVTELRQQLEQAEAQIVDLICYSQDYMDAANGCGKERIAARKSLEDCLRKVRQQADEMDNETQATKK